MPARLNTSEFINRSRAAHGDRYDYSLSKYVGNNEPLTVICKTHGPFQVRPSCHWSGKHCIKCQGKHPQSRSSFVVAATEFHGGRYSYANVPEFSGNKTKVPVTCLTHGDYLVTINNHLRGGGCPKCLGRDKTAEKFIKQATSVFGGRYDYSNVEYVNANTKVFIRCREHGVFSVLPNNHLHGYGCPVCGGSQRLTTEKFIAIARGVHEDKYDYRHTVYPANIKEKVVILCKEHGVFSQSPNAHMRGQGCPQCAEYGFNPSKPAWVYIVRVYNDQCSFIGYGITGNLRARIRTHRINAAGAGFRITKITSKKYETGEDAHQVERKLKQLPRCALDIDGFRTEATNAGSLSSIYRILES